MKSTFNDFIEKAPNYKQLKTDKQAKHIFENILSIDDNIIKMIEKNDNGKPALCACIREIEKYYLNNKSKNEIIFDLTNNFIKQGLGMMVKIILEPFGYITKTQKDIPKGYNSQFVKSATVYQKTGIANMKIVKRIEKI